MPAYRWKAGDYRVRSLVKLQRSKEAIQEADAIVKQKHGNPVLLILAIAASGEVKKTIASLEQLQGQRWLVDNCYRDADLGPFLRSEPFHEFREKFPEPPEKNESE